MKKYTKLLLTLIAVLICLTLTACGSSTKVELSPYLSVSYTGYNGNGTAHVDFDFADFEYGIMSQWKGDDQFEKLGELTAVEMTVTYAADVAENLSNGDTVTVKISFDEALAKEYGYAFTGLEKKFTVEGLTEPIMIDPFDESIMVIGVEGTAPFADLTMNYVGSRTAPEAYITYMADKNYNLANGDTVTVTATMSSQYTEQGYLLTRNEMQITVEGLQSYITDASALSAADISAIREKASVYYENQKADGVRLYTAHGHEYHIYPENIGSYGEMRFADSGYTFVSDGWGSNNCTLIIPIYTDVNDVSFSWWNNDYYEEKLVKSFSDLSGYITVSNLLLDENGQLIKEGSFNIEMSTFFENEQLMQEHIASRFDAENLQEGTFAK